MMTTKISFLLLLLPVILASQTSGQVERARQKRMISSEFSEDIYKCLFQYWTQYAGKNPHPGLAGPVKCEGIGICYGANPKIPQYAVCYDKETLIPVFTGHIVHPNIGGTGRENAFQTDIRIDPVATDEDYAASQWGLYENYDSQNQQFFARGHLTPNADFSKQEERELTMITTNIAPQWQRFNGGNWNNLETAMRLYANNTQRALYVFTGTGGEAKDSNGNIIKLNGRVLAPEWYWKAVCDPIKKQSVFFLGKNTITDTANNQDRVQGCFDILQQKRFGVINCLSLKEAKKNRMFVKMFQIPDFHVKNCDPSKIGDDFRSVLQTSLV